MAQNTDNGFDFGALKVETAEMPANGAGRPTKYATNPFTDVLAQSYEDFAADKNPGRQVKVPGKNAGEVVYLVRQAADKLNIGARVLIRDGKGNDITAKDAKDKHANRQVTVLFSAKNRKQRKDAEAPAEAPAEDAAQDAEVDA